MFCARVHRAPEDAAGQTGEPQQSAHADSFQRQRRGTVTAPQYRARPRHSPVSPAPEEAMGAEHEAKMTEPAGPELLISGIKLDFAILSSERRIAQ